MSIKRQTRHVGDTQIAIAAALQRPDGSAVNLDGLTVQFKMVDSQGAEKVAKTTTGVNVDDADSGYVSYSPQAADVDTAGTYYAYFVTKDSEEKEDTFPAERGGFEIVIEGD